MFFLPFYYIVKGYFLLGAVGMQTRDTINVSDEDSRDFPVFSIINDLQSQIKYMYV